MRVIDINGNIKQNVSVSSTSQLPAFNGLTATDCGLTDSIVEYNASATANRTVSLDRLGGFVNPSVFDFRLTLTSNLAITTSDVTGAVTLFLTPAQNINSTIAGTARVALYDGTRWKLYTSGQISLSLSLTSGNVYDVFLFDNSGSLTLETLVWSSTTARATALDLQDGILVKHGATIRRYVGTIYASGTNTTEDSVAKRFVWNMYNRRLRKLALLLPNGSHTYATADWRYWNNTSASRAEFVLGLSENSFTANGLGMVNGTYNAALALGLDANTPTVPDGLIGYGSNSASGSAPLTFAYSGYPAIGYHYLAMLEWAAGSSLFFGQDTFSGDSYIQSGFYGSIWG